MTNTPPLKTVLIIDPDEQLVAFLVERFSSLGMNTWTAPNAAAAVEQMDQEFPNLIVTDIELPVGNGRTFLEMLGIMKESREIPVIALCDTDDLKKTQRLEILKAYYVTKKQESWQTIEMFAYELVDLDPNLANTVS